MTTNKEDYPIGIKTTYVVRYPVQRLRANILEFLEGAGVNVADLDNEKIHVFFDADELDDSWSIDDADKTINATCTESIGFVILKDDE